MRKIWPVLLIVVGLLMFGLAVAQGVGGFARSLSTVGQPWIAPAASTQQLTAGTYVVYERAMQRSLGPEDVRVSGPAGAVPVRPTVSTTLTLGDTTYAGVGSFTAEQDGSYTIEVAGNGEQMVLGPEIGATLGNAFLWIGLASLGGLLALAGAVWLVVALVTGRGRAQPAPGPAVHTGTAAAAAQGVSPTPQGAWYPDPEDPGQLRWWDGRQWTEHRSPR